MKPIIPDGGYFILADYREFGLFKIFSFSKKKIFAFCISIAGDKFQSDEEDMKDFKFVRHLTKEKVEILY
jgi:hypothetical protein